MGVESSTENQVRAGAVKEHWERSYLNKPETAVSWFQSRADASLQLIQEAGLSPDAAIIDVGGGASVLVDDLLNEGFHALTVLDISGAALNAARRRLGDQASRIVWIEADIASAPLATAAYDLWHDRAVFHFLTAPEDRSAYVQTLLRTLKPGAQLVLATFAEDGPSRCSGLPVMRYDAAGLQTELGDAFILVRESRNTHRTPSGVLQRFIYCRFQRRT